MSEAGWTWPDVLEDEADARSYVSHWADPLAVERLDQFAELLLEENQRQNLISKPSEGTLWQRHFADSAQLLRFVPRETLREPFGATWLDLGTGAGFRSGRGTGGQAREIAQCGHPRWHSQSSLYHGGADARSACRDQIAAGVVGAWSRGRLTQF